MCMKINGIDVLTNFERKGFNAESESLGLKAVGILQGLGASPGEKRVGGHPLEAGGGEQAILSGLLRLDLRAFAVVPRHDSQLGQFGADHQKTMALQRVFLRAHHGYRAALQFVLGALSERRIFVARACEGVKKINATD